MVRFSFPSLMVEHVRAEGYSFDSNSALVSPPFRLLAFSMFFPQPPSEVLWSRG